MATMIGSLARQGRILQKVSRVLANRTSAAPVLQLEAFIATSNKNKDVGASVQPLEKSAELKRLTEHFKDTDPNKDENFTSYGYEPGDRDMDYYMHHLMMFMCITIGLCGSIFILAYAPDYRLQDWAQREAYLELERRQRLGLPLVDPDYVKAEDIKLPSDEEIGDQEIII